MQRFVLLLCLLVQSMLTWAQQKPAAVFTMANGLPSNAIYQTLEDNHGFLWIATDQGVARFDGKNFQVYSKEQGVNDIEVLQLVKEKNGRIWIRCFNNSVAFFNPVMNRFVDINQTARLLGIRQINYLYAMPEGGIQFNTEYGSCCFKDDGLPNTRLHISTDTGFIMQVNRDGTEWRYRVNPVDQMLSVCVIKGNQLLGQRLIAPINHESIIKPEDGRLYVFNRQSDTYLVISNFGSDLQHIQIEKHLMIHPYYMHSFSGTYLNMFYRTRDEKNEKDIMEVNVYDKVSGEFLFRVHENCIAFHLSKDHLGNRWLSTLDQGLMMYQSVPAVTQRFENEYAGVKFFSLLKDKNGALFAGNEKGEIVELNQGSQFIHKVYSNGKIEWQRNIASSQNKLFTFSDGGIFVHYTKELSTKDGRTHQGSNLIMTLNDSIILSGSGEGLCVVNTRQELLEPVDMPPLIVTALTSIDHETIYIGSTDGLYTYSFRSRELQKVNPSEELLKVRMIGICATSDSLIWIATATDGLLVMKNDKVMAHIREKEGLNSNNLSVITNGRQGEVWLGSNAGVSRVVYAVQQNKLSYHIQNISSIDGLSNGMINQLLYDQDKVYVATDNGINQIPDSVYVPEIRVELVGIQINQQDTILAQEYRLNADEKNITLQFAGIDLRGYFKHVDYSLDEGKTWTNLEGGNLSLEFESGEHSIWVKAVDVNKHIGHEILKLRFDIATPYWKTWWFWTGIMLLIQVGIGYGIYRRQKIREEEKRKVELAKAHLASLEQQAFTSLMNPHFMFNALNSIQHYINHQDRQNANRYLSDFASLIRKNFEAAQQAFIPLEQEMENIALYLRLERMRFNEKFTFEIEYSDELDPDDWMMPTMIMQPLVENSILHGIMPSQIPGLLTIRLSLQDDNLLLEVIDNGIGVENSRALKQGSKHRSRGMELIHKRLVALSFFCKQELKLQDSVPFTDSTNPGNKTSLLIPYNLYQAWKKAS